MAFQQVKWIELKGSVEEQFDVIQQQQVPRGMLIGQLAQGRRGLQVAMPLGHTRETTAQLGPDINRGNASACPEGSQQFTLSPMRFTSKQDELALDGSDFINQPSKFKVLHRQFADIW